MKRFFPVDKTYPQALNMLISFWGMKIILHCQQMQSKITIE